MKIAQIAPLVESVPPTLSRRGAHTEVAIVFQRGDISIKITQ